MKGENMEKTLEMMVEYILERCTGLETENRRLSHQVDALTQNNDRLMDDYAKQAEKMGKLAKFIRASITWNDSGKAEFMTCVNTPIVEEICEILRIENDKKAN